MKRKVKTPGVVLAVMLAVFLGPSLAATAEIATPANGAAPAKGMLEVTYYYLPG